MPPVITCVARLLSCRRLAPPSRQGHAAGQMDSQHETYNDMSGSRVNAMNHCYETEQVRTCHQAGVARKRALENSRSRDASISQRQLLRTTAAAAAANNSSPTPSQMRSVAGTLFAHMQDQRHLHKCVPSIRGSLDGNTISVSRGCCQHGAAEHAHAPRMPPTGARRERA
jgi:hypothetical protein